jgi:hypothetical protein
MPDNFFDPNTVHDVNKIIDSQEEHHYSYESETDNVDTIE